MPFQIIRNDITKVSADAIVNTANPKPVYGGGTDTAVYEAAGARKLLKEREKIGDIGVGQAAVTPAFALRAKYIIHTVGPVWRDGRHGEREAVRDCYRNSLEKAKELGCESIAFPLIATGTYGFPKADALQIAVSVFSEFLSKEDMNIILVVFDGDSFVLSGKIFSGVDEYIDENYVSEQLDREYCMSSAVPPAPSPAGSSNLHMPHFMGAASRDREIYEVPAKTKRAGKKDRKSKGKAAGSKADNAYDEEIELNANAPMIAAPMLEPEAKECEEAILADADMEECAAGEKPRRFKPGRSLEDLVANVGESWQESLLRLIDEKGYTDTEVYKRANVDRKLFSKIRSNADYQPKKITAIAFALALRLSLDETKDLLGRAGYALSPGSKFDLIIRYFIEHEVYDTYTINLALFDHDQPLLYE